MENEKIYKPETAGHLMVKNIPIISDRATVQEAHKLLFSKISFDTINYVYLLNEKSELKGVVSLKDILRSSTDTSLISLSPSKITSVPTNLDQEKIAFLALKNKLGAIPVINDKNRLVGCVPISTILQILDSESVENILRFGGVLHTGSFDNIYEIPLLKSLKHRLPWLLIGLVGGMLAAGVVKGFETTLSKNLILAAFIPLIVYMADAVGTQMEAFIIRDLAVDSKLKFKSYFLKQLSVIFIIGIIMSILLGISSFLFYGVSRVSIVLSISLFAAIISSVITGLAIPFLFSKIRLDPANASGPIATVIQDLFSIIIYFTIAMLLL